MKSMTLNNDVLKKMLLSICTLMELVSWMTSLMVPTSKWEECVRLVSLLGAYALVTLLVMFALTYWCVQCSGSIVDTCKTTSIGCLMTFLEEMLVGRRASCFHLGLPSMMLVSLIMWTWWWLTQMAMRWLLQPRRLHSVGARLQNVEIC